MANVLLVAYLLIVLAMIAVILLQRSEGGGLGMGGGGGGGGAGGLMSARGSANLLTRTTAILAALFMATAIGLTIVTEINRGSDSILDSAAEGASEDGSPASVLDALNELQGEDGDLPVPAESGETTEPAEESAPSNDAANDLDLAVPEPAAPEEGSDNTGN